MTTVSHSPATMFRCCEFFKHYDECKQYHDLQSKQDAPCQPKVEFSKTSKLLMNTAQRGVWAGIGAVTNYLSDGGPIAGALFNPLTSELNKGLNFIVSKSPFTLKKDGSLTHMAQALAIKCTSMFVVASALNTFGYPVTNTTLIVNMLLAGVEGKVPCPYPDRNPEIEQAEKFLKEYQDKIPEDMKLIIQSNIEIVKQAIANHKDIKQAKEKLASETEFAKKTVTTLDNGVNLEKSVS